MTSQNESNASSTKEQIDLLRYELDQQRLDLDRQRARAERFPTLLSAAIAFFGVVISAANIWVAYITKSKDLDIATRKDLRDFVAEHYKIIFGDDRDAAELIVKVMSGTFSRDVLGDVLPRLELRAPASTRDLFATDKLVGRRLHGPVGVWGGPNDAGVTPSEGLALIGKSDLPQFPNYFLPEQPPGTTGLARRLNPQSFYISARWDYSETSKEYLKTHLVVVTNPNTGTSAKAQPVDWGPPAATGRVADISFGLARHLGLTTNDQVVVDIQ